MLFSVQQINDLLKVIETNTNIFIGKSLGENYLTDEEKHKLVSVGINPANLYDHEKDLVTQSFHFGLLSDALKGDANKIKFEELKNYFKKGKHISLTEVERHALDSIKKQSLKDIKASQGRIFNDINNVISSKEKNNRDAYEAVIRKEVEKGIVDHKTTGEIARELGRLTGDWGRNFNKSIEYISHLAMSEGRIASIEKRGGKKVYMQVYKGACVSCVKLYMMRGLDSQPRIFTIEQLKANGSNIKRKVIEWKATYPPCHIFCRCHPTQYIEGSIWNDKTKRFELPKLASPINRAPIRYTIEIGGKSKEYFI
jgi:hypothetical protein